MDDFTYELACLALALVAVAILSGWIVRRKQANDAVRSEAAALAQWLRGYGDWVAAQRLVTRFAGDGPDLAAGLVRAERLRGASFPQLAREMADLLLVHGQLLAFLASQHDLWRRDPTAWFASDHDARFMQLWRRHHAALQALLRPLDALAPRPRAPATSPLSFRLNSKETA